MMRAPRVLAATAGLACLLAAPAARACVGDCNGNAVVAINELIVGVNIALGASAVDACRVFDRNGDGAVGIGELLAAVNNAIGACPAEPTLTDTPTAQASETPTPTPTATPTTSAETRCTVTDGTEVNFDPTQPFCEVLSSYRFFQGDGSAQAPNADVLPYDLNTPLFSDYAAKHRFVWMPAGVSAAYHASESFAFPVGAVLIKTFAFPIDERQPELGERLIETRLLVRRADKWEPITYVWNDEQTEAKRRIIGKSVPVEWIRADGSTLALNYQVPNTNQCKECHEEHDGVLTPLGPKARNLNKDYDFGVELANQLTKWTEQGYLSGAPEPAAAPQAAVWDDPQTGSVEVRARTYLDVNCGSCHNPTGLARTSGLYLNLQEANPARYGVCKGPVAAGQGAGTCKHDIYPGLPDRSILVYRMQSIAPGVAMPELGRQTAHSEAITLIEEWIAGLPGDCTPAGETGGAAEGEVTACQ